MKAAGRVHFSPEMVISMCFSMGQPEVSCSFYLKQTCFSIREEDRADEERAVHIIH